MENLHIWTGRSVDQVTTDAFVDLILQAGYAPGQETTILELYTSGPVSFDFKNTGAQTIAVQILSANNKARADAEWNVEHASFTIAAAAVAFKVIQLPERAVCKVQVKSNAAGQAGALRADICHKRT